MAAQEGACVGEGGFAVEVADAPDEIMACLTAEGVEGGDDDATADGLDDLAVAEIDGNVVDHAGGYSGDGIVGLGYMEEEVASLEARNLLCMAVEDCDAQQDEDYGRFTGRTSCHLGCRCRGLTRSVSFCLGGRRRGQWGGLVV